MTAKAKGTTAETAVVRYLNSKFWPHAERRALAGGKDKGDIIGSPGLVWEVKAAKTLCIPAWLRETESERVNAKADYGVLVVKPEGVGRRRMCDWYALMPTEGFGDLLQEKPFVEWTKIAVVNTTIRRLKPAPALKLARSNATAWGYRWYWVNYPGYMLTDLNTVCDLLNDAGYGSE